MIKMNQLRMNSTGNFEVLRNGNINNLVDHLNAKLDGITRVMKKSWGNTD